MALFGSSSPPETFPEVRATDLDGKELTLPADLPAPLALVIVLFQDDLDPLADQWARLGDEIAAQHAGQMAVVETPVVGRGMKLFGSLATMGIRGQVDDDAEHARTLPIYVDKKPFRKTLKLSKEADVYPFLVERATGAILWAGEGAIDMHEVQSLEAAVSAAISRLPASPLPEAEPPSTDTTPSMAPRDTPGGLADPAGDAPDAAPPEASGDDVKG
ncbi:hypothetical protein [Rubricoccus marinus]|uniref:Thioredoxin domain-containing protein n=1 Tax=Rubricoccus marinus TaxID=716817 RepID=A0A259TZJ0_9BACT|nr:hypothetical protein [Rubricoccus marinus]OZC03110.1 hypothetical protein BSZ36_09075 [Rubricoccus marinus]